MSVRAAPVVPLCEVSQVPDWLPSSRAAQATGLPRSTLMVWVKAGAVPASRLGTTSRSAVLVHVPSVLAQKARRDAGEVLLRTTVLGLRCGRCHLPVRERATDGRVHCVCAEPDVRVPGAPKYARAPAQKENACAVVSTVSLGGAQGEVTNMSEQTEQAPKEKKKRTVNPLNVRLKTYTDAELSKAENDALVVVSSVKEERKRRLEEAEARVKALRDGALLRAL